MSGSINVRRPGYTAEIGRSLRVAFFLVLWHTASSSAPIEIQSDAQMKELLTGGDHLVILHMTSNSRDAQAAKARFNSATNEIMKKYIEPPCLKFAVVNCASSSYCALPGAPTVRDQTFKCRAEQNLEDLCSSNSNTRTSCAASCAQLTTPTFRTAILDANAGNTKNYPVTTTTTAFIHMEVRNAAADVGLNLLSCKRSSGTTLGANTIAIIIINVIVTILICAFIGAFIRARRRQKMGTKAFNAPKNKYADQGGNARHVSSSGTSKTLVLQSIAQPTANGGRNANNTSRARSSGVSKKVSTPGMSKKVSKPSLSPRNTSALSAGKKASTPSASAPQTKTPLTTEERAKKYTATLHAWKRKRGIKKKKRSTASQDASNPELSPLPRVRGHRTTALHTPNSSRSPSKKPFSASEPLGNMKQSGVPRVRSPTHASAAAVPRSGSPTHARTAAVPKAGSHKTPSMQALQRVALLKPAQSSVRKPPQSSKDMGMTPTQHAALVKGPSKSIRRTTPIPTTTKTATDVRVSTRKKHQAPSLYLPRLVSHHSHPAPRGATNLAPKVPAKTVSRWHFSAKRHGSGMQPMRE